VTRYLACTLVFVALAVVVLLGFLLAPWIFLLLVVFVPLAVLTVWDLTQRRHSLLRNYPLLAHMRWLFEGIRPEIRQYLLESDSDLLPFSRDQRSLVYQRAKGVLDSRPFGTKLDTYGDGFTWLTHSITPKPLSHEPGAHDFRVTIGGPGCTQPYSSSVINISGMSFGALSGNAILALNKGAKAGGFAHDTGEGSISQYHREHGGDLIWQIGSGYFGCRSADGTFDAELFAERAREPQVKMIEIKLSQGAKPGHGGVLPAAKISPEIAAARGVPMGRDCISPGGHSAFETPLELIHFIARLRELSDGKPVGFKLCIGHPWEFMAIIKAMLDVDITPDFIVIDGKEGGTGAAPIEFSDHIGTPLAEGLSFARSTLTGAGLDGRIKLAASGKRISAFDIVWAMALGADWCNIARGFMFALGCIQAQACHTNCCPVGVATQDRLRQRALVVGDKAERVANYHRNTMEALAEITASAGLAHPIEFEPDHLRIRQKTDAVFTGAEAYPRLAPGALLDGRADGDMAEYWRLASAESFAPNR
jgi:glutamate synthase domain-containing protein 2